MHLHDAIQATLEGRRLLEHPFYRRWEAGELQPGELAAYATQYEHLERQLPVTLATLAGRAESPVVREALESNLRDELGVPAPHLELFGAFADGVGARAGAPTPATAALTALYATAAGRGVAFGVGVLAAYEVQAAEIARTKAEGLRSHYGASAATTRFWDVHAELEDDHAGWSLDAAEELSSPDVLRGVAASRDAWWAFLDERESLAA